MVYISLVLPCSWENTICPLWFLMGLPLLTVYAIIRLGSNAMTVSSKGGAGKALTLLTDPNHSCFRLGSRPPV